MRFRSVTLEAADPSDAVEVPRAFDLPNPISFEAADGSFPPPVEHVDLEVVGPSGHVVDSLEFRLAARLRLAGDDIITGVDASGLVRLNLTRHGEGTPPRFSLSYSAPDALPADMLRPLRFLSQHRPPNQVQMRIPGVQTPAALEIPGGAPRVDAAWVDLVRSLAYVQRETGRPFSFPRVLSAADVHAIGEAERLLRGATVVRGWRALELEFDDIASVEAAQSGSPASISYSEEFEVEVAGHHLSLGLARLEYSDPVVASLNGESVVRFVPSGEPSYTIRLERPAPHHLNDELAPLVELDADFLAAARR